MLLPLSLFHPSSSSMHPHIHLLHCLLSAAQPHPPSHSLCTLPSHRSAEPLGERLGLAVLRAGRAVVPAAGAVLNLISSTVLLPRVAAHARLAALEAEQTRLLEGCMSPSPKRCHSCRSGHRH